MPTIQQNVCLSSYSQNNQGKENETNKTNKHTRDLGHFERNSLNLSSTMNLVLYL